MLGASLLILLQAASGAAPTASGSPQRELKMDMQLDAAFLASADANRDGALSLSEFQAELDRRLDAKIAGDPAAQKKIGAEQRVAIRERMMAPGFRGMDKNSDGLLTKDEVKSFAR